MKKSYLILILLSQFIFYNCSTTDEKCITDPGKDEIEIIVGKLQVLIDEYKPTVAQVYVYNIQENGWVSEGECNGFEIDSPFIKVCGKYYNLANLVKFEFNGSLNLYFKY